MKKRIISLIMVLALLAVSSISALAFESEAELNADERVQHFIEEKLVSLKDNRAVVSIDTVKDFAGQEYKVAVCAPKGYFIVHPEAGIIVEYNLNAVSPFNDAENPIYGGPTFYYDYTGNECRHTVLGTTISFYDTTAIRSKSLSLYNELLEKKYEPVADYLIGKSDQLPFRNTEEDPDHWISNHAWFQARVSGFGYVDGGYCGYIAANLVLKYHNNYNHITLPSTLATINSTALTNALIAKGNGNNGTTAVSVSNAINAFAADWSGVPANASWAVGSLGAFTEINTHHRPCILFGSLPDPRDNFNSYLFHAVVAYGYNFYENPTLETWVCHYGWDNYEEVHIVNSMMGTNTKYAP